MNKKKELISIIVPVYNAEDFLADTIKTVQDQTYQNWEMILVDDYSKDNSIKVIQKAMKKDKRIKLFCQKQNGGAALARNRGIMEASGDYICFLDADDLWHKDKLQKQLNFMKENKCAFSFTGYQFVNVYGMKNGKKVWVPKKISYKAALKNTTISTITTMFNMHIIDKKDITMPNVKSEDTATWWQVLKKVNYAYSINEILSYYRRSKNTSSSNKIKAVKQTWNLYRNVEKFNIIKSLYYFGWYIFNAIKRRV